MPHGSPPDSGAWGPATEHMAHNDLPHWTYGPGRGWYCSSSRISSLDPQNACLGARGHKAADEQNAHPFADAPLMGWSRAVRGTSWRTPCVVRPCARCAWCTCVRAMLLPTAGTPGVNISSPKNIYWFYKAEKKKSFTFTVSELCA